MKKFTICLAITVVIILVLSVFTLSGCKTTTAAETTAAETTAAETTAAETTAAETTAAGLDLTKEVDLVLWNPTYEPFQIITPRFFDGFKKLYPNVNISEELITWDTVYERVAVGVSTNTAPDIMWASDLWIMSNAGEGQLLTFNDLVDFSLYPEGSLTTGMIGDELFMYPQAVQGDGMNVNIDMVKGLDSYELIPKDITQSWTIDDFLTVLRELKEKGKVPYGLGAGNDQGDQAHCMWIWTFGGKFFNPERTKTIISSPESVEALEFYKLMEDEGLLYPGAASLSGGDVSVSLFSQQKFAFAYGNPIHQSEVQGIVDEGSVEPFEMRYIQVPSKPEIGPKSTACLDGYVCFKSGDPLKEYWAKKFAEYACSDENIWDWLETVWPNGPPKTAMIDTLTPGDVLWQMGYMAKFDPGERAFDAPNYSQRRATFYPEIQAVLTGQKTPKEALDSLTVEWDKLLKR